MSLPQPTTSQPIERAPYAAGASAAIDGVIHEMQTLLDRMRPRTGSEALRALREAFPQAPLSARVEAMQRRLAG